MKFSDDFLDNFIVCAEIDDCLNRLEIDYRFAVGVSRLHAKNYPPIPFQKLRCFNEYESIYSYFIAMFVREDHPQLEQISRLTQRAFEGGLIVKWQKDAQLVRKEITGFDVQQFGVQHMGAALLCFIVCLIFSIMAFVAEILVHRQVSKPNPSRFWIIYEMLIDNERYLLRGSEHPWIVAGLFGLFRSS